MRNFPSVVRTLISLSQDAELTTKLQKILRESACSAPEIVWRAYGTLVSEALQEYMKHNKRYSDTTWFINILSCYSEVPAEKILEELSKMRKQKQIVYG